MAATTTKVVLSHTLQWTKSFKKSDKQVRKKDVF